VRVEAARRNEGRSAFEFMNSDVSSEKPKRLVVARVADRIRRAHASPPPSGGRVVVVAGPAVVHTGAAPELARLVRHGHVDVLLAGNGFATHDIESNLFGTSLGVALGEGSRVEHGHANHLRAINTIRRAGSIARAVETGVLRSGVMYECVVHQVPFLLAGSLRDDGPLPDVVTDTVVAADRMRELVSGARVAVMLASTLHAIATGNVLPADVETFCVDINPAVVTKLTDRGSHQATGIVTDTGLFLRALADELIGTEADR
jgi:lysine-ketoglutarate reductase/saccharopine dehydrogenase-like protein (TIGR00300 family)